MTASTSPQSLPQRHEPTAAEFRAMQASPEFIDLKKTFRRFTFPVSVAFFVWYLTYVLLAIYGGGFFAKPVFGNINVGVLFGLLQFVTTYLITALYIRYANREIEPRAARIREEMEG